MLQLRCLPLAEEELASDEHGCVLEVAADPERLLLTLNLCRLAMPANTHPLHIENWQHIEALVQRLAIIHQRIHSGRSTQFQKRRRRSTRGH